jgi:cell shape-determining protein MreC
MAIKLVMQMVKSWRVLILSAQTGFVYEIFETADQGVYFVGFKNNVVQKVQYNLMLSSQLSKSTTTENEALKLEKYLFFPIRKSSLFFF